jgi:hypothetical protein
MIIFESVTLNLSALIFHLFRPKYKKAMMLSIIAAVKNMATLHTSIYTRFGFVRHLWRRLYILMD